MILFGIIDRPSMARYMKAYFWFYVHLDLSLPFLTGMPVPAVAGTGWMAVLCTFGYPARLTSSLMGADGGLFCFLRALRSSGKVLVLLLDKVVAGTAGGFKKSSLPTRITHVLANRPSFSGAQG